MTDGSPLFPLATPPVKANRKLEVRSSFALIRAGQRTAMAIIIGGKRHEAHYNLHSGRRVARALRGTAGTQRESFPPIHHLRS